MKTPTQAQSSQLIYVGDPMCSWCYGIAEELSATVEALDGEMDVQLIMGGLRAGGGEAWNATFRDFLRHHWEDVRSRSGQPFSFDLLDRPSFDYDTEPACRAVVVAMGMDEDVALRFFKEVQKGFYLESRDPKDASFYEPICREMGLDYEEFSQRFVGAEAKAETKSHFQKTAELGVRSFPTVILHKDGAYHLIASGYATADQMLERIQSK